MITIFAAVHDGTSGPWGATSFQASSLIAGDQVGIRRVSSSASSGLGRWLWKGLKTLFGIITDLVGIGLLTTGIFVLGASLWRRLAPESGARPRGRLIPFPAPEFEDRA